LRAITLKINKKYTYVHIQFNVYIRVKIKGQMLTKTKAV